MKKVLSILLALTLCLTLAVSALAVEQQDLTLVGDAYYDPDQNAYVLTEDKNWQSSVIWLNEVRTNADFSIEFDFYTGDKDDGDGIWLLFYVDSDKVTAGSSRLTLDAGEYAAMVVTWPHFSGDNGQNYVAINKGALYGNHLAQADATAFTEDGQWHHWKTETRSGVCTITIDGVQVLQQDGIVAADHYNIGIYSQTGAARNLHMVKNIVLNEAKWSNWANDDIEEAIRQEIIPDVLIDQDLTQPINRAEFAAVCVKVYENLTATKALPAVMNPFTDTADTEVLKAYNVGITNGTSAATFSPANRLSREEAATMLTRVFKRATLPGWTLDTDGQFTLTYTQPAPFADDADISGWARDSVYFMVANNIINGVGGNKFAPKNTTSEQEAQGYANATREQALAIAVRMVENLRDH